MKQFRIEKIVLDQLDESVQALVDKNYFSDEDYAVSYLIDIVRFFQLTKYDVNKMGCNGKIEMRSLKEITVGIVLSNCVRYSK